MGVCSGRLKRGVLGAGTARKRGVLGAGPTRKKGGLRCGSGQKRGVFTAAHTYTEHICEYPPPGGTKRDRGGGGDQVGGTVFQICNNSQQPRV